MYGQDKKNLNPWTQVKERERRGASHGNRTPIGTKLK